jgi:hypothetical protein
MDLSNYFQAPGGISNDLIGSPIASAETIYPDRMVHHVTGTANILNIVPPYEGFAGPIYLIPDGAFGWSEGGNIASGGYATVKKAVPFIYDPETLKWYTLMSLKPFTVLDNLTGVVPISVGAIDFIGTPGDYTGFEISLDPAGPWSATYLFTVAGTIPVYIRGQKSASLLIKPTTFAASEP